MLRSAHRLDLTPLQFCQASGLAANRPDFVNGRKLLQLSDAELERFMTVTQLNESEVENLTLSPWKDAYPSIGLSLAGRWDKWIFHITPRFCPQCLTGNSTEMQRQLGGARMKYWHLPVAFACIEHNCILSDQCPRESFHARRSALSDSLIWNPNSLVAHPSQCRISTDISHRRSADRLCRTYLKAAEYSHVDKPDAEIINCQKRILNVLHGNITHEEFNITDLRLTAALITASWPKSSDFVKANLRYAVDAHVESLALRYPKSYRKESPIDSPPTTPIRSAALLSTADAILNSTEVYDLVNFMFQAAYPDREKNDATWAHNVNLQSITCSKKFKKISAPIMEYFNTVGMTSTRDVRDRRRLHSYNFAPCSIPSFLEPGWWDKHFSSVPTRNLRTARRLAAIKLVQLSMGGAQNEAAAYLDIPYKPAGRSQFRAWSESEYIFANSVRRLALELEESSSLIDYRKRRIALQDWAIDTDSWNYLLDSLSSSSSGQNPMLDNNKRQAVSMYIWTLVTNGEYIFAPAPLRALQSEIPDKLFYNRVYDYYRRLIRSSGGHYGQLRILLAPITRTLAQLIDEGEQVPDAGLYRLIRTNVRDG
ncbi:TniQ family protein [Nocardia sp. CA2R105]|nr:TniQ family protein [Nocardia coffeae]